VTAFVGGIAIGSAISGAVVESQGWRVSFLIAAAAAAVGTVVAVTRRGTLSPVG
jgi:predicted MFS family arabinose efflux permease